MQSYLSAIFDTHTRAEGAISELRALGIPDDQLSIVSRQADAETFSERMVTGDVGGAATTGFVGGAGVGALFGLAAVLIPGVAPFLVAGALVSALGIGAATVATGAIAGASAGALAGALAQLGFDEQDTDFNSNALELGHCFVSISALDQLGAALSDVTDVFARHGGRWASTGVTV